MTRRSGWSWLIRYAMLACTIVLLLLQIASLPLYAGASGRWCRWRFEHGRLTIARTPSPGNEQFYIAGNSEGLRWTPYARFDGLRQWELCVPVWMPLAASIACGAWAWRRKPRRDCSACASCGFSLVGLKDTKCPECGTKFVER